MKLENSVRKNTEILGCNMAHYLTKCSRCGQSLFRENKGVVPVCFECKEKRKREYARINFSFLRLRFKILGRDNFTCQYCGRSAPDIELQVDHKIPASKGGKTVEENLITSCKECNQGKGDQILPLHRQKNSTVPVDKKTA